MFITEHKRRVGTAIPLDAHAKNLIAQGYEIQTTEGFPIRSALDVSMHDPETMFIQKTPSTPTVRSKTARSNVNQNCPKCEKQAFKAVTLNGNTPAMFCESCRHVDYATTFQGAKEPPAVGSRYKINVGDNPAAVTLEAVQN